jgi:uncharacterized protein (TIGR02265 family)
MGGVIFRHTVEAFFAEVVDRLHLFTHDELRAQGLWPPRDVDIFAWVALLRTTASRLRPDAPAEEALEEVGREMVRGYVASLTGRSLFALLRMLGPRRAMLRLAENYRTADSVTEVVTTQVSPTHLRLAYGDTGGVPTYVKGVLAESLERIGVTARIAFIEAPEGVTFDVRWDEAPH